MLAFTEFLQNFGKNKRHICMKTMEQQVLKNVNNCLNTNVSSYLEISVGQISNLYLNDVHLSNNNVNKTSVAAKDSCFLLMVSNTCCSIALSCHICLINTVVEKMKNVYI